MRVSRWSRLAKLGGDRDLNLGWIMADAIMACKLYIVKRTKIASER